VTTTKLPTVAEAKDIANRVVADVFFNKLDQAGIVPQSQEEAASMLRTAEMCVAAQNQPEVKAAALAQSPVLQAEQQLAAFLGKSQPQQKTAAHNAGVNQLASVYAQNPAVYQSMLALALADSKPAQE